MKTFSILGLFFGIGIFIISSTPSAISSADNPHQDTNEASEEVLHIGVLADDDAIVSSFVHHPSFVTIDISSTTAENVDAIVISNNMLANVSQSPTLRTTLLGIARQNKPLIAPYTSLTDLADHLDLTLPMLQTETTQQVMSSLVWERNGTPTVRVLLISEDRMSTFYENDLTTAIYHHVAHLTSSDTSISQVGSRVFLPLIVTANDPGVIPPLWEPAPRVEIEWNDCPFGLYRETLLPERVNPDQDDDQDFYSLRIVQQTIPGKAADEFVYPDCEGSAYRLSRLLVRADLDYFGQQLYAYGPTTTSGETVATVNIGISAGEGGASVSLSKEWSFAVPFIRIRDYSDLALDRAEWEFDFDIEQDPANTTFLTEPGVTVSTGNNVPLGMTRRMNLYWNRFGDIQRFDTWYYTITSSASDICRPSTDNC